jgi:hypothetical protein
MNMKEFAAVINHIAVHNSPFERKLKDVPCVKYMYPSIDFRTNTVFAVKFAGFGGSDTLLHCQNECRDLPESLYERIMKYLDPNKQTSIKPLFVN